jgi:serine/threonine protein kinase/Tol biopolymer transport system component
MVGRTILHYRIVGVLGSGGMGVVYDAEDLKLGRRVALKFLPAELARDSAALERLRREARAASHLNHPNICTVYAIEEADTEEGRRHFIAMERLEGESLDRLIARQRLPADVALEIGVQVADALDAAHTRGIIHRDIKPGNVFVQARHRVKVLDFGLAKVAASHVETTQTAAAPAAAHLTSPGTTLGTVAYMSPEQARGDDLDARSDLFSFGAVLYEMCTGRAPFDGKTSAVIFQKILDRAPEPPHAINPSLPTRLAEVILKALEKDRDLRCQTAAEMRADLKRIQRDTTAGHRSPELATDVSPTTAEAPIGPPSSGSVLIAEARRHKTAVAVGAVAIVALLTAAGYGIYRALLGGAPDTRAGLRITAVTTSGAVTGCTSISPDGRLVVYCERDPATGVNAMHMRQVATNTSRKLLDVPVGAPTFSPDGNLLYILREGELFVLPAFGGEEPKRVLTEVSGRVTVSPSGRQLAFVRDRFQERAVVIADRDGSAERTLLRMGIMAGAGTAVGSSIAWSPDGKVIAVASGDPPNSGLAPMSPAVIDVTTGKIRKLTDDSWRAIPGMAWLQDGSGLVFLAVLPGEIQTQLWFVSYPGGETNRVTNDLHGYGGVGVSADGTIVVSQSVQAGNVWISDPAGGNATLVTTGKNAETIIGWTADRRLIYISNTPGRFLWAATPGGGPPRRLPVDVTDAGPIAMASGHDWLLLQSSGLQRDMWRVKIDGTDRRPLRPKGRHLAACVTSDGAWILYVDWESGFPTTFKMPADGGTPEPLAPRVGRPIPSPDSHRFLGVLFADDMTRGPREMGIFRMSDGTLERPVEPFGPLREFLGTRQPQWAPDGRSQVFLRGRGGVVNLWSQPFDGGDPQQLTKFDTDSIFSYAYSPDGKLLATARGRSISDVVLIRNFR